MPIDMPNPGIAEQSERLSYWRYLTDHVLELFAMLISVVGILGYTAGASFNEGWNSAAGVPSALFAVGPYDTVLKGLRLETPWLLALGFSASCMLYVWFLDLISAWTQRRLLLVKFRRMRFEGKLSRYLRGRRATAARTQRLAVGRTAASDSDMVMRWRALGSRGVWKTKEASQRMRAERHSWWGRKLLPLGLSLTGLAAILLLYVMAKAFLVQQALHEGVYEFVDMYAAVTGRVPAQFKSNPLIRSRTREIACEALPQLWKHRAANLKFDSDSAPRVRYVLQSSDKIVLTLDSQGSGIHSFGDASFTLDEAADRPTAKLVADCRK